MARRSINDVNYDEAVTVDKSVEQVQGQPQSAAREPSDGKVDVNEVRVALDQPILDPNHELAVQIPEGIGATATDRANPLTEAFEAGTAEEQFAAAAKSEAKPRQAKPKQGE